MKLLPIELDYSTHTPTTPKVQVRLRFLPLVPMIIVWVTRVFKSQVAEPLLLGLVILFFFFFNPGYFFQQKTNREQVFLLPDAGMTGGCLKYHQYKMHMLDTTSAFLYITRICPCSLEMAVIFGILFPHKRVQEQLISLHQEVLLSSLHLHRIDEKRRGS